MTVPDIVVVAEPPSSRVVVAQNGIPPGSLVTEAELGLRALRTGRVIRANIAGSYTLDWAAAEYFDLTMTAPTVLSFVNIAPGCSLPYTLRGAFAPTFPSMAWQPSPPVYEDDDGTGMDFLAWMTLIGELRGQHDAGIPPGIYDTWGLSAAETARALLIEGTLANKLVPLAAPVTTPTHTALPNEFTPLDTTANAIAVALPTAPPDGTRWGGKIVILGAGHGVTFQCGGADVLNKTGGSTSGTLSLLSQAVGLQYKASDSIWYIVADDLPLSQLDARYDVAGAAAGAITTAEAFATAALSTALAGLAPAEAPVAAQGSGLTHSGVGATVGGVVITAGMRVLDTATGISSGIWLAAVGAWTRPVDFATGSNGQGKLVDVDGGSVWLCVSNSAVTVDTTSQVWTEIDASVITAGTGLTKVGNAITLPNTGPGASSSGDATHTSALTIDALGRIRALASTAIALPESAVTGLVADLAKATAIGGQLTPSVVTASFNTGSMAAGTWTAAAAGGGAAPSITLPNDGNTYRVEFNASQVGANVSGVISFGIGTGTAALLAIRAVPGISGQVYSANVVAQSVVGSGQTISVYARAFSAATTVTFTAAALAGSGTTGPSDLVATRVK
jgi:hypothetical protein